MARRPFFTGDYGSALGRIDTRPIIEAGRAQGQMFAGLGAEAAKAIETYQLNKERQKEDRNTIKSSVGILERLQRIDPDNADQYGTQIEQLKNDDIGLRERANLADKTLRGISITGQLESRVLQNKNAKQIQEQQENIRSQNKNIFTSLERTLNESDAARIEAENAGLTYKEEPFVQRLRARKELLEAGKQTGDSRYLPGIFGDPSQDQLNSLNLLAKQQGRELYDAMGGVEGEVKRQEEDRDLRGRVAESLIDARKRTGQSGRTVSVPDPFAELGDAQSAYDRQGNLESNVKGDDGKPLTIRELIIYDPDGSAIFNEEYADEVDGVTRNNVRIFRRLSGQLLDRQNQLQVPSIRLFKKNEIQGGDVRVGTPIRVPGIDGVGTVIKIDGDDVRVRFEQALGEQISEEEKAKAQEEKQRLQQLKDQAGAMPGDATEDEKLLGPGGFGMPLMP
jgi:hypothetical protein